MKNIKHWLLFLGSKATFLFLALLIAASPIGVEAQPLPLEGMGGQSGNAMSREPRLLDETPASSPEKR